MSVSPSPLSFCGHLSSSLGLLTSVPVAPGPGKKVPVWDSKSLCVVVMLIGHIARGARASLSVMLIHLLPQQGGEDWGRFPVFSSEDSPFGMKGKGAREVGRKDPTPHLLKL